MSGNRRPTVEGEYEGTCLRVWGTKMRLPSGFLALVAIAATLMGTARAAGTRGSGQGEISGYTVSDVHFELSSGSPSTITAVTFSLEPEPSSAARVSAEIAGASYPCVLNLPAAVCLPSEDAALLGDANSLTVTAGP